LSDSTQKPGFGIVRIELGTRKGPAAEAYPFAGGEILLIERAAVSGPMIASSSENTQARDLQPITQPNCFPVVERLGLGVGFEAATLNEQNAPL
jgi:hypothetical protein